MSKTTSTPDGRAEHVALGGLFLQFVALCVLAGVAIVARSPLLQAAAYFAAVGLPIWFVLYLVLKQLRRVRSEELEAAEILRAQGSSAASALFDDAAEELALEKNRLRWMVRYLMPTATVFISLAILAVVQPFCFGAWRISETFAENFPRTLNPTVMAVFVVFVGLACFWFARYTITLARLADWQLLHAGAVCMVGNAVICLAIVITLLASSAVPWLEPLIAAAVRLILLIFGIELAGNFILDFYRPSSPDYIPRPSFDSRLLGLIGEPGSIAKSIASAINYQFGFEVSGTWFYLFLQRWMLPLVVVTVIIVILLTSVVIVNPDEHIIVERFGIPTIDAEGQHATLSPGLNWKLPFPIDMSRRAPTQRINEIVVGEATTASETMVEDRAVLWTKSHKLVPELMILVASPASEEEILAGELANRDLTNTSTDTGVSVAVSTVMVSIPIEYRINNIKDYLYNYDNPEKVMEGIVYQLVSDFAASVDLDELMGPGRARLNERLHDKLQARLAELNLGIELVFVGIRGAHPPANEKVAAKFQAVVGAEISQRALVNQARGEANRILTQTAGSLERAKLLDDAILALDEVEGDTEASEQDLLAAQRKVDELLMGDALPGVPPLGGEASELIARARAERSRMITNAITKTRTFGAEVIAWKASEQLYTARKRLEIFEALDFVRKFLVIGDPSRVLVEYADGEEAGLDRVLNENLDKERARYQP